MQQIRKKKPDTDLTVFDNYYCEWQTLRTQFLHPASSVWCNLPGQCSSCMRHFGKIYFFFLKIWNGVQKMNIYECSGTNIFIFHRMKIFVPLHEWKNIHYLFIYQLNKSFLAKQNSPCLAKIYFVATAGNCGLIMHGLHTSRALYEFALRTHNWA